MPCLGTARSQLYDTACGCQRTCRISIWGLRGCPALETRVHSRPQKVVQQRVTPTQRCLDQRAQFSKLVLLQSCDHIRVLGLWRVLPIKCTICNFLLCDEMHLQTRPKYRLIEPTSYWIIISHLLPGPPRRFAPKLPTLFYDPSRSSQDLDHASQNPRSIIYLVVQTSFSLKCF